MSKIKIVTIISFILTMAISLSILIHCNGEYPSGQVDNAHPLLVDEEDDTFDNRNNGRTPEFANNENIVAFSDYGGDDENGYPLYSIYTFHMNTSELNIIYDGATYLVSPTCLSWSPDDEKMVFTVEVSSGFYKMYYFNINPSSDFANPQKIEIPVPAGHNPKLADWSPDGEWIAYFNKTDNNIWKIRLDGTDATQITTDGGVCPKWSPDGDYISYEWFGPGCDFDVYIIPSDGGTPERLTTSSDDDGHTTWSPDGEWIAYSHYRGLGEDPADIWVVSVETGETYQITNCYPDDMVPPLSIGDDNPTWSPDGDWLVFYSDGRRCTSQTLWKIDVSWL